MLEDKESELLHADRLTEEIMVLNAYTKDRRVKMLCDNLKILLSLSRDIIDADNPQDAISKLESFLR